MIPARRHDHLSVVEPAAPAQDGTRAVNPSCRRLGLAIALVVLCGVFALPLLRLGRLAAHNDAHSHIPLIPVIAGWLVWTRRRRLALGNRLELFPGSLLLAISAVLLPISWTFPTLPVAQGASGGLSVAIAGFVLGVLGLTLMFLGRVAVRQLLLPLVVLLFMVPLPATWVAVVEGWLAQQSAAAAYAMLKAVGLPVVRQGVVLAFPGLVIQVAHECSGIRSTLVLLITAVLLAGLCLRTGWRRALLVALVIPLGIFRNGFRVFVLAGLSLRFDPSVINSPLHHKGGPIFFVLALGLLMGALWVLAKTEPRSTPRGRPGMEDGG
jgi:exosortase